MWEQADWLEEAAERAEEQADWAQEAADMARDHAGEAAEDGEPWDYDDGEWDPGQPIRGTGIRRAGVWACPGRRSRRFRRGRQGHHVRPVRRGPGSRLLTASHRHPGPAGRAPDATMDR